MLFLTKVVLDTSNKGYERIIQDCVKMHQFVMSMFPQIHSDTARCDANILYVIDESCRDADHSDTLYIQSSVRPYWNKEDYRIKSMTSCDATSLLDKFKEGQKYNFTVLANPRMHADRKTGKYIYIRDKENRKRWVANRLPGCEVSDIIEENYYKITGEKKDNTVTVVVQRFSGQLQITDAEEFRNTFVNGAGPAKSYGCGMVQLFPTGR